jgi:3-dehydroquinate dehydratase-2
MKILVIHGVNLNFLGKREKTLYGTKDLDEINNRVKNKGEELKFSIETFQSNHEGQIVDKIQQAYFDGVDYIVINPGAFTHYSVAIRDAILAVNIPAIEVHITNVYKREEFRHKSVISDIVIGKMTGFGDYGYIMALDYINNSREQGMN